jgi:hypothetical protein
MIRRKRAVAGAFALVLAAQLRATTVPSLSFEELTDQSEVVVNGQVNRSWSEWDSEHKYIWTHYEIRITGVHKGSTAGTVIVSEPGGVVGDRGMSVAGVVSYAAGEQVAVFLQRMPNGFLRTTGWWQGKFGVDANGRLHASSVSEVLVTDKPGAAGSRTSLATINGLPLTQLHAQVAARVAAQHGSTTK